MTPGRGLAVVKTAVAARITMSLAQIESRLGELAVAAGPQVARQIHAYVQSHRLGYYPALSYFETRPEIDPGLVAAVEQVGAFVCNHVRAEIRTRLWPVFSHVRVAHMQLLATTLPAVRPNNADVLTALIAHYTPNSVKVDMVLSNLEKGEPAPGLERFAASKVVRWLGEAFEAVEITDARRSA